jgi:hypothetical protein
MNTLINYITNFTLIGLLFISFLGCSKNEKNDDFKTEIIKEFKVELIYYLDLEEFKGMILFEDENFLIKSPFEFFLFKMDNMYGLNYADYLSVFEKIILDIPSNDNLDISAYFDKNRANYILANNLENGFCVFYDKKSNKFIKDVVVKYWSYAPKSIKGGGRKFYINNELFTETDDAFIGSISKYTDLHHLTRSLEKRTIEISQMPADVDMIFNKSVILYEDENFLMKTPLAYFLSKGNGYILNEQYLSIITSGKTNNVIHATLYYENEKQANNWLAQFMEIGSCYCFDKIAGKVVDKIQVEYWHRNKSWDGYGGRSIFINDGLFLEIVDYY